MAIGVDQIYLSMTAHDLDTGMDTGEYLTANVYTVAGVTNADGSLRRLSIGGLVMALCLKRAHDLEMGYNDPSTGQHVDGIVEIMNSLEATTELLERMTEIETKTLDGDVNLKTKKLTFRGEEMTYYDFLTRQTGVENVPTGTLIEELVVDRLDSLVCVVGVDEDGDLDLGGRDHANVDLSVVERLEHLGRNARVALHACADDGDLGNIIVEEDLIRAVVEHVILDGVDRVLTSVLGDGEADVLLVVVTDGLENDVDVDVLLGKSGEHLERDSGNIGNALDRDPCDFSILGDAAD